MIKIQNNIFNIIKIDNYYIWIQQIQQIQKILKIQKI
jgi:hypothetical protein